MMLVNLCYATRVARRAAVLSGSASLLSSASITSFSTATSSSSGSGANSGPLSRSSTSRGSDIIPVAVGTGEVGFGAVVSRWKFCGLVGLGRVRPGLGEPASVAPPTGPAVCWGSPSSSSSLSSSASSSSPSPSFGVVLARLYARRYRKS
jgi:hypothetical protein